MEEEMAKQRRINRAIGHPKDTQKESKEGINGKSEAMDDIWEEMMTQGSDHYKTGGVEPLDLIRSGGMLHDKIIADIIKYAYRNRRELETKVNPKDIAKIHHLADMLKLFI